MKTFGERRPEIDYPGSWTYRVICTDEVAVRAAIVVIVGEAEHTLARVGGSRTGRYHRLELVVTVRDEQQRDAIFAALGRTPSVKFVL